MSSADGIAEWFAQVLAAADNRRLALEDTHRMLSSNGLLSKVTLHRYMCRRGCQIAVVFKVGDVIACAVRDYKFSPGMNEAESVPAAREKNTLDGDRWWPSHVYDVAELADWGPGRGMDMNCRHHHGTVNAADVLAVVEGVQPGHPGAPSILGATRPPR